LTHEFVFRAAIWLYEGSAAWHFVTLPKTLAARIKSTAVQTRKAFGSVRVEVTIGGTRWRTSIFPDNKLSAYVLPIKTAVRTREQLKAGMTVEVVLVTGT
jgi:hypothetical protein